ncbi:MAG: hypothetical protein WDO68_17870 [Gammaproteobacteria bacterium]
MKSLTTTLAIATVALAATSIYLATELHAAREQAQARPASLFAAKARRAADQSVADLPGAGAASAAHSGATPPARTPTPAALPGNPDPQERAVRPQRGGGLDILNSPQGREMMRVQMKAGSKRTYADAIQKLALGRDKSDALLNLLADQQLREADTSSLLRGDRTAMEQARAQLQSKSESEINALLGPEKATTFAAYQKSLPERSQVNYYAEQLDALNLPMRDDQKEQFVSIMMDVKQGLPAQPQPTTFRDVDAMQARVDWQASYDRAVLDRASSVLTSEQYNHIRSVQEWQLSMQQQSLQRSQRAQARGSSRQR